MMWMLRSLLRRWPGDGGSMLECVRDGERRCDNDIDTRNKDTGFSFSHFHEYNNMRYSLKYTKLITPIGHSNDTLYTC